MPCTSWHLKLCSFAVGLKSLFSWTVAKATGLFDVFRGHAYVSNLWNLVAILQACLLSQAKIWSIFWQGKGDPTSTIRIFQGREGFLLSCKVFGRNQKPTPMVPSPYSLPSKTCITIYIFWINLFQERMPTNAVNWFDETIFKR